jgi:hypothetical protein
LQTNDEASPAYGLVHVQETIAITHTKRSELLDLRTSPSASPADKPEHTRRTNHIFASDEMGDDVEKKFAPRWPGQAEIESDELGMVAAGRATREVYFPNKWGGDSS